MEEEEELMPMLGCKVKMMLTSLFLGGDWAEMLVILLPQGWQPPLLLMPSAKVPTKAPTAASTPMRECNPTGGTAVWLRRVYQLQRQFAVT